MDQIEAEPQNNENDNDLSPVAADNFNDLKTATPLMNRGKMKD